MPKQPRLFGKRYNHKHSIQHVNYDQIADKYNKRNRANSLAGVENSLVQLVREVNAKSPLEVGCGTGRWLDGLAKHFPGPQCYGLDYSQEMLTQDQSTLLYLIRGKGSGLPLKAHTIDLWFCVNALHHFDDPKIFIFQTYQLLRPEGTLAIIGQTPQDRRNRWLVSIIFKELSNST